MTTTTPFGRMVTAMVTPMKPDGSIDYDGVKKLAEHLVANGHDGLVVNGTTGESATTTDEENIETVRAVADAVKGRTAITAGVGTNDTAHSVRAAKALADAGADAVLVVTPYYNKPTQAGIVEHFKAVVGATDLPAMAYDIPGRSGTALASDTIRQLATIDQVRAVKDAKGDFFEATKLMDETDLLWYSGDDVVNLAWLALGAVGVVSVVGHVAGNEFRAMIDAVDAGDLATARAIHTKLIPAIDALMNTSQGAIMVKAALKEQGVIDSDAIRLPLLPADEAMYAVLRDGLTKAGLL
ncbi:4-hydroxy-tetrahydrodipicolinate synthase [Dermacoccus nishinomiyaensis]|uniref:4-hydroxy-tetrahydrodipicolinate synthase n=1 Tax=Dermacoccus TaxID=57495 RepID=UPI00093BF8BF|nr:MULTISPECIES: 4-hydroxy-tetrahydrodipicolinate synthase [Dermacoccus]HCQ18937.1 4-hydroxy-tetrahydrodipicolinate synthase [Dermacoccus sp.]MBO1759153.1 4-hydroxy-tetrahydrodipicolinate synthase [Dermacoccus sp. NHGro5]MCG7430094.1 4-hydroxy-tetrahydrodipicolinate synthase [Dermacoccus nishinomiyaensis]MCI0154934.1 4-hydroxy-tetrahydrodipicolinate synthase [Dermacoccus nishinomiyaensis]NHC31836.1 4-hydroxy-tetrahydrodipicolinate synthase [Dermacoccus nishinomiyaensis]